LSIFGDHRSGYAWRRPLPVPGAGPVGFERSADLRFAFDLCYSPKQVLRDGQPLRTGVLGYGSVQVRWHISDLQGGSHIPHHGMRNACTSRPLGSSQLRCRPSRIMIG
jgi:hypothetical protein